MSDGPAGSWLYRGLSRLVELVIVNAITLVACIPVVTIGAALTACHGACIGMITGNQPHPARTMVRTFRRVFARATAVWLALMVLVALLVWEWMVAGQLAVPWLQIVCRGVIGALSVVISCVAVWVWPLLARSETADDPLELWAAARGSTVSNVLGLLRSALLTSVVHLPRTLGAVAVCALPAAVFVLGPEIAARILLGWVLIGIALTCFLVTLVLARPLGVSLPENDRL